MREAEDWARFQNVPKAEALIAMAKQMAAEEPSADLGNRLRQLQALWKDVGPMPQRRSKELWDQFKQICDQVYDKVKGFRAVESEKFAEVVKIKEALIADADALADSTDWAATADKLKALQARWKDSGHLPRKQGDELWKRFRAACDTFFERRKPQLDARHAEETDNLERKQALIARAQAIVVSAGGEGGWGKAIAQIKDLQREWKDIGFVPRRDADAVYTAFRAACDALFAKRDESRDAEANAHRAELDALVTEIEAVKAGGDDRVARAIAVRAKVRELDRRDLSAAVDAMIRDVIAAAPEQVKGTELDPAAAHARRARLIAKAEDLLPKHAAAPTEPADIAAQLEQAMRANAFGDLRFSGRDPVEVIDELRARADLPRRARRRRCTSAPRRPRRSRRSRRSQPAAPAHAAGRRGRARGRARTADAAGDAADHGPAEHAGAKHEHPGHEPERARREREHAEHTGAVVRHEHARARAGGETGGRAAAGTRRTHSAGEATVRAAAAAAGPRACACRRTRARGRAHEVRVDAAAAGRRRRELGHARRRSGRGQARRNDKHAILLRDGG